MGLMKAAKTLVLDNYKIFISPMIWAASRKKGP